MNPRQIDRLAARYNEALDRLTDATPDSHAWATANADLDRIVEVANRHGALDALGVLLGK